MLVARGIEMLEISAVVMGRVDVIHPSLIWDAGMVILVDTGYPGQLALFHGAMERAGVSFDRLNKIIITHQDLDHIGGLPVLLKELPQRVEVLSSEEEKPYIQGEKKPVKITAESIEQAVSSLPADVSEELRKAFRKVLENPPGAGVDKTVSDGELLPYCGGITVIKCPGHSPGHICLYYNPSKTLIAGDALRVAGGRLAGPDPQATYDMDTAVRSLKKLAQYDIETVICYHGGLYKGEVNRRIAEL